MFIGNPIHDDFYCVIYKDNTNTSIWQIINNEFYYLVSYDIRNYVDIAVWAEIEIVNTYNNNISNHLEQILCL